jgi:hypothetical protein
MTSGSRQCYTLYFPGQRLSVLGVPVATECRIDMIFVLEPMKINGNQCKPMRTNENQ